jgi:adenylate cyclase
MPAEFPTLTIKAADGGQSTCLLDNGIIWKIGRGHNNTIVLPDEAASRRHAMIQRTEMGDFYLIDAGSRNGTYMKDQRVRTPVLLRDGDEISIGVHKLIFANPMPARVPEITMTVADSQTTGTRVIFAERLITVLVIDIRGFTKLTQQVEQDVLCKFISRWFADASEIFRARGSWALKYIGDAVMAAWLHDHDHGEECRQILAALAGLSELAGISTAARYSLPCPLRFGAGLNTGVASIGNAGSGEVTEYTAFGDTVNTAFRIEAGTRQMNTDLAIGQRAVELLGGRSWAAAHLKEHSLEMKGYDAPATVWAGSFEDLRDLLVAPHPVASSR